MKVNLENKISTRGGSLSGEKNNMLETSKDLLNLLIGLSIFMVAAFFSWVLYQMGRAIKGFNDIIDKVRNIADSVHGGIKDLRSKSSQGAAYLGLFIKGGLEILKHLQKRKAKSSKKPE